MFELSRISVFHMFPTGICWKSYPKHWLSFYFHLWHHHFKSYVFVLSTGRTVPQLSAFTLTSVATQLKCWRDLFLPAGCPSWRQTKHIKYARVGKFLISNFQMVTLRIRSFSQSLSLGINWIFLIRMSLACHQFLCRNMQFKSKWVSK